MVIKSTNEKIPYFNAPIYLQDKADVGKVFDGTSRTREKLAIVDEVRPNPTRFPRTAPSGR